MWSISTILQLSFFLFGILRLIRWFVRRSWGSVDLSNEINIQGKTVLVTGANTGIGKVAALEFAKRGACVILACRDTERAKDAVKWIRSNTIHGQLICMQLDLSSLQSIRQFSKDFNAQYDKLDILVNNAGVVIPNSERKETEDGFEMHMGVNHLGHFLLTNLLLEPLKKATPSRVVTVSSMIHSSGVIDFDDLMFEKRWKKDTKLFSFPLYANSKLANALFNKELAKRLEGTGVNCYALCPGMVETDIGRNMKGPGMWVMWLISPLVRYLVMKTPEEGAATIIYCALDKHLSNASGGMYEHCRYWDQTSRVALKDDDAEKLWEISSKLVGLC